MMMVEAFDTWRRPKVPFDYGRFFDANSDADIAEMVNAAKNSPAVILWSIGNEIPDSTSAAGIPMAQRLIADIRGDRHEPPDRDRLGQVPQRAGAGLAAGPDPRPARRPGAQLQHRRLGRRAARALPGQVPVRVRVLLGGVHPRRLPGPRLPQHRRELHAGQARHVLLRQQPRVVDDERRVRAQEGPRPQVLHGPVPVVGLRLHRRADALRRVPGQVVVLRRGRHRGLPQGHVLALPQPMDRRADGPPAADELDRPRGRATTSRCGRTPTCRRSSCSSTGARSACAASTARRRSTAARTSRRARTPTTTRPSPAVRIPAATRARTAAPASCT